MQKNYILSIDVGTSSCKVLLFDQDGTVIQTAYKEHSTFFRDNGGVEQNPEHWWQNIVWAAKSILEKSNINKHDIVAIGVDSQSSSMIPITSSGEILYPAMIWTDRRAKAEKQWIDHNIGQSVINSINGNHNDESNVALKLMWLRDHEHELYKKTDCVLNATGYIVYKLTGRFSSNISEGGLTQIFDIKNSCWSDELIQACKLDKRKLPDLYPCHEIVGNISRETASLLGLSENTKVTAGAMDVVSCALGCGVIAPGDSFITGGTVTAMGVCSDQPISSDVVHVYNHIVPGTWCNVAGVDYGGGNFRWFRDQFMQEKTDNNVYDHMNFLAEKIAVGADKLLFLPTLVGQRCPQWDTNMKGMYFGITPNHTKGHFIRALMEGNAFAVKEILDLQAAEGVTSKEITIAGGISKSKLWMQIFAEVLNVPLYLAFEEEATAVGNMMTAAYGVGLISSFHEFKAKQKKERVECNAKNIVLYQKIYQIYSQLYPAVKEQFKELAELDL